MVNLSRLWRRSGRQYNFLDKPDRERHFISIVGSVLSIVLLILSLALKEWAKGDDGQCSYVFGLTEVHISMLTKDPCAMSMTHYYSTSQQILISCVLSVTALTILSSLVATIISLGFPRERLEFLRHYSVFNIVSLLCIVLVAGLWLAVAETLPATSSLLSCKFSCVSQTAQAQVSFGYAYYILLVGGLFSLGAASFNLLRARTAAERRRSVRVRFRQNQQNQRQEVENARRLTTRPPPAYSLIDTDPSDTDEAETSLSEPEPLEDTEPITPPPPYSP